MSQIAIANIKDSILCNNEMNESHMHRFDTEDGAFPFSKIIIKDEWIGLGSINVLLAVVFCIAMLF